MKKYLPVLVVCVVMALLPFYPEPHLVKQWNRLNDGTFGEAMDYVDLVIHGGPLIYLIYFYFTNTIRKRKDKL